MSDTAHAQQGKNHSASSDTKAAESSTKAAVSAGAVTRVPAWANAWGDQPPFGLQLPVMSIVPGMQAKLAVSQPGDPDEREADQVAEQVMRMPASVLSRQQAPISQQPIVQRKCACGGSHGAEEEECEECATKRKALQRRSTPQSSNATVPPVVNQVLSSDNGQTIDAATRAFMEPRFGTDFSQVRVHTDGQAAESAQSVSALAYTVGSDVVFGKGQYQPETSEGQKLLAHELTHVVQQQQSSDLRLSRKEDTEPESLNARIQFVAQMVLERALLENSDLQSFREYLTRGLRDALSRELTPEQLQSVLSRVPDLTSIKVPAPGKSEPFNYLSAAQFLKEILGMPPDLAGVASGVSYGTDFFIHIVTTDMANYLSQPIVTSGYSKGMLEGSLRNLIDGWGDPENLLNLELEGTLNELLRARMQFESESDQARRKTLGAHIGELARRILLLNQTLEHIQNAGQKGLPTEDAPLEKRLQSLQGQIATMRQSAQEEEPTLRDLGNAPTLLRTQPVALKAPLEEPKSTSISPEEAFPTTTDAATVRFLSELVSRVQQQASELRTSRQAVLPSNPRFTLPEFAQVYRRWFAFFSVNAREADPLYQSLSQLYRGIYEALGPGGIEGGIGRSLLTRLMADYISRSLGGAHSDFAGTIQRAGPVYTQDIKGTATDPRYRYAQSYPGSPGSLDLAGERSSREAAVRREMEQTAHFHNKQAAEGWTYLISVTEPVQGTTTRERKIMPPEVARYLLAEVQQLKTLEQKHMPGIGEGAIESGGVEAGEGTSKARYLQGEKAPTNPEVTALRSQLTKTAEAAGALRSSKGPDTSAERTTQALIKDLEGYLDQYFQAKPEAEFRIAAILIIGNAEYNISEQFMQHVTPAALAKAILMALGISAALRIVRALGPIGEIFSEAIEGVLQMNGVSLGAGIVSVVSWMLDAQNASNFREARLWAFFSRDVADDLGQLLQMAVVSTALHAFGSMPRTEERPGTVGDVLKDLDPILSDPEIRKTIAQRVEGRINELEAKGAGKTYTDPMLEELKSIQGELQGVSTPYPDVKNIPLQGEPGQAPPKVLLPEPKPPVPSEPVPAVPGKPASKVPSEPTTEGETKPTESQPKEKMPTEMSESKTKPGEDIEPADVTQKSAETEGKKEKPEAPAKKEPPNPYGSRGGPQHRNKIQERIEELKKQGYEHLGGGNLPEEVINIPPGGYKKTRRPDITMRDPSGKIYHENVGRSKGSGDPIAREERALEDIERATGSRPKFTPYDK